ncbi:MAG TPA: toluene-4-monooxygenase system B family protein [Polyangiaceae bacterium]
MLPLHGFVRGDTCGVLVLVDRQATIATLAALLAQAASIRVAPARAAVVSWNGRVLDANMTVAGAGLTALDRVELVAEVQ